MSSTHLSQLNHYTDSQPVRDLSTVYNERTVIKRTLIGGLSQGNAIQEPTSPDMSHRQGQCFNFNTVNNDFKRTTSSRATFSSSPDTPNLNILYTNCDCLTQTKLSELHCYIESYSPDIIALSEVLPKSSTFETSTEPIGSKATQCLVLI